MATATFTPDERVNFFRFCRIIIDHVTAVLRQKFHDKKPQWSDADGQEFLDREHWDSRLTTKMKSKIKCGKIEEWDCTVLFHMLLFSSHGLLTNMVPVTQHELKSGPKTHVVKLTADLSHIKRGSTVLLNLGNTFYRTKVTAIGQNDFSISTSSYDGHTIQYNKIYVCSPEWLAVEELSCLRNNWFAHLPACSIAHEDIEKLISKLTTIYKKLKVPQETINEMLSMAKETIVEDVVILEYKQKLEAERNYWGDEIKKLEAKTETKLTEMRQEVGDQLQNLQTQQLHTATRVYNLESGHKEDIKMIQSKLENIQLGQLESTIHKVSQSSIQPNRGIEQDANEDVFNVLQTQQTSTANSIFKNLKSELVIPQGVSDMSGQEQLRSTDIDPHQQSLLQLKECSTLKRTGRDHERHLELGGNDQKVATDDATLQKIILKNMPTFGKFTDFSSLASYLFQFELLTPEEHAHIRKLASPKEQALHYYTQVLPMKGATAHITFYECLKKAVEDPHGNIGHRDLLNCFK